MSAAGEAAVRLEAEVAPQGLLVPRQLLGTLRLMAAVLEDHRMAAVCPTTCC